MPYKSKEKRRAYQKEWIRQKRAEIKKEKQKLREKEIEAHIKNLDLNYGIKTEKPKFVDYKEWKKSNEGKKFKEYLKEKRQFDFENKDFGEPLKIAEGLANYSERAYAFAVGMSETDRCRKLKEALKNCKSRQQAILIESLIEDDCP